MGQVKKAFMSETMDDMGDISREESERSWELSKFTVEELEAELDSRGWKVVSK